jgi:hypothetical protein
VPVAAVPLPSSPHTLRRIVTGVSSEGRSRIAIDERLPLGHPGTAESLTRLALLETAAAPASNAAHEDPVPGGVVDHVVPERGGALIRIVDIPPETGSERLWDVVRSDGVIIDPERSVRHPGFHRTDTLDCVLCLHGEVWMLLDEDEILLRAGDVVVQRGTHHAWANRTAAICRVPIVMLDAEPLTNH